MPPTVRGFSLSFALCALTLGGCLDRGGLDPLPDAGGGDDGGGSGGATGGSSGSGGARSGGASGSGGASHTGGATATGGASASGGAKATGGGTATGGRMGGSGGAQASGGAGGLKGTGGVVGTGGSTGTGGKKMCGAVCDIFCPYGNVLDSDGCPTCKCNPMPNCPQIKCAANCPNGYLNDEKGCQTCMCNPDNTCTAADCGTMPPVETIVCPAGTASPAADTGAAAPIVAPYVCARDATTGKCVWQSRTCRPVCPAIGCANMCPNGYEVGADGCQTCTCRPAPTSVCGSYSSATACAADASCRWLQPGCSEPALAAAGCFAKDSLGCTTDASCGTGHQCLKRVVNPCFSTTPGGVTCGACGAIETICQ